MTKAMYWRTASKQRVACDLCYRKCVIDDGAAGWCQIRANEGGKLVLRDPGVISHLELRRHPHFYYRRGQPVVWLGATSCTAGCVFCTSGDVSRNPERLQPIDLSADRPGNRETWRRGRVALTTDDGTFGTMGAEGVIERAHEWGAKGVYLTMNEPTLTIEYTLAVARLAHADGLFVSIDSNAFTNPAAIAELGKHIDHVYVGVKGHADPAFYDKRMRSPGAVPHVYAALLAWKLTGVVLGASDIVTPPHWLPDEQDAIRQMETLYGWISANLGTATPLDLSPMLNPIAPAPMRLLPKGATATDRAAFDRRTDLAAEVARSLGLTNVNTFPRRWLQDAA